MLTEKENKDIMSTSALIFMGMCFMMDNATLGIISFYLGVFCGAYKSIAEVLRIFMKYPQHVIRNKRFDEYEINATSICIGRNTNSYAIMLHSIPDFIVRCIFNVLILIIIHHDNLNADVMYKATVSIAILISMLISIRTVHHEINEIDPDFKDYRYLYTALLLPVSVITSCLIIYGVNNYGSFSIAVFDEKNVYLLNHLLCVIAVVFALVFSCVIIYINRKLQKSVVALTGFKNSLKASKNDVVVIVQDGEHFSVKKDRLLPVIMNNYDLVLFDFDGYEVKRFSKGAFTVQMNGKPVDFR